MPLKANTERPRALCIKANIQSYYSEANNKSITPILGLYKSIAAGMQKSKQI